MSEIIDIINDLRAYPTEREWFEFKHNWFDAVQIGEYISALSNAAASVGKKYAYFVWGIDDKTHDITGTDFDPNCDVKGEPLKHFLSRQLTPDVHFIFEELQIDGEKVVVLKIPAAKTVPVSFANERFIRIGSSKENIRKYPEKESYLFEVLRHGLPTLENTPSQYQDLTFNQLLVYYAAKGIRLNEDTFKQNLGFYTFDGKYNMLAQLLSDNSHFVQRVAIFAGKSKTANLLSVREFGLQCMLYTLDEVLRYGDVLNIIQADERNRIVERKETALFENDAFREAMINAFVHNRWVDGNEPMISVFSDRIEILSRGPIPPEQTLEGFFAGVSIPVNQKLSEIFLQLHISEKTGRGVPKVVEKYNKSVYSFNEHYIVVTIPFRWINSVGWNVEQLENCTVKSEKFGVNDENCTVKSENCTVNDKNFTVNNNGCTVNVPKIALETYRMIQGNKFITSQKISDKTGLSLRTVKNHIALLKERGLIIRVGSDKTGHWEIVPKGDADDR